MSEPVKKAIVIGGSAGSVKVIFNMLKSIPQNFPVPIIIALHRPDQESSQMGSLFKDISKVAFDEPNRKTPIKNNHIYLAPAGKHIVVETDFSINIDTSPLVQYSRPSIDVLFLSAAEVYKRNLLGIILTGSNEDGSLGLQNIKKNGGLVVIQDPKDASISRMPEAALAKVSPDMVLTKEQIFELLKNISEAEKFNVKREGFNIRQIEVKST